MSRGKLENLLLGVLFLFLVTILKYSHLKTFLYFRGFDIILYSFYIEINNNKEKKTSLKTET